MIVMAMRLHIRIEFDPPRSPESGCGVFRAATAGPVPRIAMLAWSVAAHILLVVLIAVISRIQRGETPGKIANPAVFLSVI